MNTLVKKLSIILLCTVFINPIGAMEKGKVPANYTHNVPATSTDDDDHDWKCPICLEEKLDSIVTLRRCGHRFHSGCIKQKLEDKNRFLNTDTRAATNGCLQCEGDRAQRSLITLMNGN